MTKRELYQKRYDLLKQALDYYGLQSTNEILNERCGIVEEVPAVEEKIVFVPKDKDVFVGNKLDEVKL